ncbi:MAG TPA: DUF2851 family protein, partial [Halalkalibaculum sp.]|nr:DUF2851 family protein [Halalkalibaculum sp.]
MSRGTTYPEELLHWVWKTSRLEMDCLETVSEETVTVYNVGNLNPADGPDFLNTRIQIGNLEWFGDVEIHWRTKDWNLHNHHTDANYNRVILHVVWSHDNSSAKRQDGTAIPTLQMKQFLSGSLQAFLERYQKPDPLPCAAHLSYISQDAFEQQLSKAKHEYFEQKVNDLMNFWDASLPPSLAWKQMLAIGLFDALGISHNRRPLRELCRELYPRLKDTATKEEFISLALQKSGVDSDHSSEKNKWNHKGSRPANQPRARIQQAAAYLWHIQQFAFKDFLVQKPMPLWRQLHKQLSGADLPGSQTRDIICAVVWLPSFFILGNIFGSGNLKSHSYALWKNRETVIPKSLLEPFRTTGLPAPVYRKSLGTIHQL